MAGINHGRLQRIVLWALIVVGSCWFSLTLSQLANFPRIHGDEVGIMAPAYKLAQQGIYGSDMYRGFYQADQHYMFTLPFHHFVLALAFKLFGAGVLQARLVSVVAGLLLLITISWLAYSWFGRTTALLCLFLLLLWRSQLTAAGAPIAAALRSARYDMVAVLCIWLAIALLVNLQQRPQKVWLAWASGLVAGLASVTQFYGLIVVPLLLFWGWAGRSKPLPFAHLVRGAFGFLTVAAIYGGYILMNWGDYLGQNTLHVNRMGFTSPSFYWQNSLYEFQRYRHLLWPAPRPGGLFCVVVLLYTLYRLFKPQPTPSGPTEQRLAQVMGVAILSLALVDRTKAPLYSLMLTPGLCLLAATGVVSMLSQPTRVYPAWAIGVTLAMLLAVESGYAWLREWQTARSTTPYPQIGARIEEAIQREMGSRPVTILGPERWWWALHTHRFYADHNLWGQWRGQFVASNRLPDFGQLVRQAHIELILLSPDQMQGIKLFPELVEEQYWEFIAHCTTPLHLIEDATYGRIEVLRVRAVCIARQKSFVQGRKELIWMPISTLAP